ncbi:hypothetical protein [Rothia kristinae]|uniref:hypothetical protein n=1 Tax=Rothia kristinae TaxID=37923 RepID=UPI0011A4A5AC|nr:hypothetical protein [Rothia kristinae]
MSQHPSAPRSPQPSSPAGSPDADAAADVETARPTPDDAARERADAEPVEAFEVRRAPSVVAFLLVGVAVGLVVALFSTLLGPVDQAYTLGAIFGMMAVIFGTAGAVVGAIIGLILDRRSKKRVRRYRAVPVDEHGQPLT